MQETPSARWMKGSSAPFTACAVTASPLWQPAQVTPTAAIGPGWSGTPRPPVPA